MWFNNLPFSLYGSLWPSFWSSPFRFDWCQNEFQESVNIDANEPMFNLNLNYFIKNINFYSNKLIHFLLIHLVLPIWRWWWSFCILTLISIFGQFTISHLIFIAISWWSRITTRRYISCLLSLCCCRILRIVLNTVMMISTKARKCYDKTLKHTLIQTTRPKPTTQPPHQYNIFLPISTRTTIIPYNLYSNHYYWHSNSLLYIFEQNHLLF